VVPVLGSQVLDSIATVSQCRWTTDACLAGLVCALDDILYFQNNLCGWGQDKTITEEHLATRLQRVEHRVAREETVTSAT
jgi:hypothetical protein